MIICVAANIKKNIKLLKDLSKDTD